jgi:glutathione S-transferase
MAKLKLTYFDFDGGRGEPVRLALHIGGIPFEDRRVAGKDWPALREQMPFRAIPVLEVDGAVVSQSNSLLRYAGKLAGLYPKDDLAQLRCDEVLDAVEDLGTQLGNTIEHELGPEGKKKAREALAAGPIPRYLEQLQQRLQAAGGEWFGGKSISVADLKAWSVIRWLRSGVLDHIPKDLVDRTAPALVKHAGRKK